MSIIGRLKCHFGLHAENVECEAGGYCYLECSRCGAREMFATPEDTQRLYDAEGQPELGPLRRNDD